MESGDRLRSLTYDVLVDADGIDLSEAAAETFTVGSFECSYADQRLCAVPTAAFADVDSARAELEPALLAWEAYAAIGRKVPVRFRFLGADVDRAESRTIDVSGTIALGLSLSASATLVVGNFPPPPSDFLETPAVALLRRRLADLRAGHDRLLAVGYYAYTVLSREYSGAHGAAHALAVDLDVLKTLNTLTSDRSHPDHERKSLRNKPRLTDAERAWVDAAITGLTIRMGQVAGGATGLPQLTVQSFGQVAPCECPFRRRDPSASAPAPATRPFRGSFGDSLTWDAR